MGAAAAPDALDQLGAEARELEQDAQPKGETAGAGQDSPNAGPDGATGGAPGPEVIQNPAPHIAAALTMARDVPLLRELLPAPVIGALSDTAIAELAGALGDLAVKYGWKFTPELGRWKEEVRAAMALGSIGWSVYQAMRGDGDAARADRAKDVTPKAEGYRDPPHPAAEQKPVEPGGA